MGIHLRRSSKEEIRKSQRGFSLLEQIIALGLIVIGTLCALETTAYCLLTRQLCEEEWQREIKEWNEIQEELLEDDAEMGEVRHEAEPN